MVNMPLIAWVCGWIVGLFGLAMLLPLIPAVAFGDGSAPVFLAGTGISLALGALLALAGRKARGHELHNRESLAVVGISWFLISFFGAMPYWLSGQADFWAGLFESFSGFSSTGATNIPRLGLLPQGLLFWRSFSQWLGGMGIIVLMCAVLPFLGAGGQLMMKSEISGHASDKLRPRVAQTAKILWALYSLFTLALFLLLLAGGEKAFDSLCLALTTVSTGGFSNFDNQAASYRSLWSPAVCLAFMFLGSLSFTLWYQLFRGQWRALAFNPEAVFLLAVSLAASAVITFSLVHAGLYRGPGQAAFHAVFQAVSVISTTGMVTADWEAWPSLARGTMFFLFFVGGCSGSTSGGIKCLRWIILFKCLYRQMRRHVHPRGVFPVRLGGKSVPEPVLEGVWIYFFLYLLSLVTASLALSSMGIDFLSALSSAASALGNVGPALGPTGPASDFASLPGPAKGVLSLLMLLGRLEFYSFLVLFLPEFWGK
jgi:trk system potassium uptake protein TrkH